MEYYDGADGKYLTCMFIYVLGLQDVIVDGSWEGGEKYLYQTSFVALNFLLV